MLNDNNDYTAGESTIKDSLVNVSKIYVDLPFVKYVALGRLLSYKNMTAKIYHDIIAVLEDPSFLSRYTDCPKVVCDNVRGVSHMFEECRTMDVNSDQVLLQSPPFTTESDIALYVSTVKRNKQILEDNTPISIDLNTYYLPNLSEKVIQCLSHVYTNILGCEVNVINKRFKEYALDEVLEYDTMFIYQLSEFNEVFIEELDRMTFFSMQIFARKILPKMMIDDLEGVDIEQFFTTVYGTMRCACKFEFARTPNCIISP